jgi:hypothetical protein
MEDGADARPWALDAYGWDPVTLTAQRRSLLGGREDDDHGGTAHPFAGHGKEDGGRTSSGGSFPVLVTRDLLGPSKPARLACQVHF